MTFNSLLTFDFKHQVGFKTFDDKQTEILVNELYSKLVDEVEESSTQIDFKVSFLFQMSWSLMTPINKGRISLMEHNNRTFFRYQVEIKRFVIIGTIFSLILGLVSMSFGFFILIFSLMVVFQSLIARYRHDSFFEKLILKIKTKPNIGYG